MKPPCEPFIRGWSLGCQRRFKLVRCILSAVNRIFYICAILRKFSPSILILLYRVFWPLGPMLSQLFLLPHIYCNISVGNIQSASCEVKINVTKKKKEEIQRIWNYDQSLTYQSTQRLSTIYFSLFNLNK